MRHLLFAPALLMLSACGGGTAEQVNGAPSPNEEAALNDAAEMLDQSEADGNVAEAAQ